MNQLNLRKVSQRFVQSLIHCLTASSGIHWTWMSLSYWRSCTCCWMKTMWRMTIQCFALIILQNFLSGNDPQSSSSSLSQLICFNMYSSVTLIVSSVKQLHIVCRHKFDLPFMSHLCTGSRDKTVGAYHFTFERTHIAWNLLAKFFTHRFYYSCSSIVITSRKSIVFVGYLYIDLVKVLED